MEEEIASNGPAAVGVPGGSWYTWWHGDALRELRELPPLAGFRAEVVTEPAWIAVLTHLDAAEAHERVEQGHRAYVAFVEDTPAGWGWSATRAANIGELGLTLWIPPGNRYLWSFETTPQWRGQGVYPRLLQCVLRYEAVEAKRFWIGHEPGNMASARGIMKAGFEHLGELAILPGGEMLLAPTSARAERVQAGAAILGGRVA